MENIKNKKPSKKMVDNLYYNDQRRLVKLVGSKGFDMFIMLVILADAIVQGLMTSPTMTFYYDSVLFLLDRIFMGIFITEMLLKILALKAGFFKSGWNIFDLVIVAISALPLMSIFIVLRTFRLLRVIKFENRNDRVSRIVKVFLHLLPIFSAFLSIFIVFFYVFAIMAVNLYGDTFVIFGTLGSAMFSLLQVFTLDGWATAIARPVMMVYPNAWIFFGAFLLVMFLLSLSFIITALKSED